MAPKQPHLQIQIGDFAPPSRSFFPAYSHPQAQNISSSASTSQCTLPNFRFLNLSVRYVKNADRTFSLHADLSRPFADTKWPQLPLPSWLTTSTAPAATITSRRPRYALAAERTYLWSSRATYYVSGTSHPGSADKLCFY